MSKETYILQKNVHFGTLKFSVNKGAKIIIDKDNNTTTINGRDYENVSEIDLCIRKGFIIPASEIEASISASDFEGSKSSSQEINKLSIEKSDVDNMNKDINISKVKNEIKQEKIKPKMEVIRESESEDDSRGLAVITSDKSPLIEVDNRGIMEIINADDGQIVAKISSKKSKPKGVPETGNTLTVTTTDSDTLEAINCEQGRIVKTIGKSNNTKEITSSNKLTAKRASKSSSDKAKANAEARKKASEARRAKTAAKENE
jgi:hypothetical protein